MSDANQNCFYINPVDERELTSVTKSLKSKTSKDFNEMSMEMVKNIDTVCKPICHICNLSFSSGIFPENMKIAKVLPLFKGGDKTALLITIDLFLFYHSSLKF